MTLSPTDHPADSVSVDLCGRTALVTGAGSGIGRATALRLARAGAHVRRWDITGTPSRRSRRLTGGTAEVVDLSDLDALDRLDLSADIVVNCAGIQHVAPVHEFPHREVLADPADHARGTVPDHPRALPHMYAPGLGPHRQRLLRPRPARLGVQERLRLGQARARGPVEGGRARGRRARRHLELRQPRLRAHPAGRPADRRPGPAHGITEAEVVDTVLLASAALKRLVEPEEVADAVAFLCSPPPASMTGTSLVLDGGWSAR